MAQPHGEKDFQPVVQLAYWDVQGRVRRASPEAVKAVWEALDVDPLAPRPVVEPVAVAWDGRLRLRVRLAGVERVRCALLLEDGRELGWTEVEAGLRRRPGFAEFAVPGRVPLGAHRALVEAAGQRFETVVLSAPRRLTPDPPPRLGLWVPTYALWSRVDGRFADFELLRRAARWACGHGAGVLATLPLFTALLDEPFEPSPYLPASRLFWNELFVHVPGSDLPSSLDPLVDYRAAFARRRDALERAWRGLPEGIRERVRAWARARKWLGRYAAFRAWLERYRRPWRQWSVAAEAKNADPGVCEVYTYAQWLAHLQLQEVAQTGVWLYLDLPLGVHPDGFDTWQFPQLFVPGVSVGAPPDPFSPAGQDWSFAPVHPQRARQDGHAYLRACLAHLFQVAKMVRLDHVMALHRLYWIPRGFSPDQGVYVRYPVEEMYAAVLLEAARAGAVVVGEDLGTVPREVRRELDRRGLWRMYVLAFEAARALRPPGRNSVASLGTHDTAPFAAFWEGSDLEDRERVGLLTPEQAQAERARRQRAVEDLAHALGLHDRSPPAALRAALRWLAESPAGCVLVHLEDLWLDRAAHNVPGTTDHQHPNWRRRLRYPVEAWDAPEVRRLLQELAAARRTAP